MARAAGEYRRLPGRKRTLVGAQTLWLGGDHLLLVENRWFTEHYRRIYFSDLQAVLLRSTPRFVVWAVADGILVTVSSMILADVVSPVWRIFWTSAVALSAGTLLVHLLRGQTCACHMRTPLGAVEIRCLGRLRRARRVLERLRPLIEQAQGPLPAGGAPVVPPVVPADPAGVTTRPAAVTTELAALPPLPVRREAGRPHMALFGLLLLDAVLTFLQIGTGTTRLDTVASLVLLAQVGCVIAALIKQRGSDLSPALRKTTWASLVYVCAVWTINNGLAVVNAFMKGIAKDRPLGLGSFNWAYGLEACIALVLGAAGLLILRTSREGADTKWLNLGP